MKKGDLDLRNLGWNFCLVWDAEWKQVSYIVIRPETVNNLYATLCGNSMNAMPCAGWTTMPLRSRRVWLCYAINAFRQIIAEDTRTFCYVI